MQNRPEEQDDATWQKTLEMETKFFAEDKIWSQLPDRLRQSTGSIQLRKKLSLELSRLIRKRYVPLLLMLISSIPGLIDEVNNCTNEIKRKLNALPQLVEDEPRLHLDQLCKVFNEALDKSIKGEDDGRDLALMIESADRKLLESVRSSIIRFGLADYGERRRGFLVKSANDFLLGDSGIAVQVLC
jgi:hypothetical protein